MAGDAARTRRNRQGLIPASGPLDDVQPALCIAARCWALIGENGAGKSTLMPRAGRRDRAERGRDPHRRARTTPA